MCFNKSVSSVQYTWLQGLSFEPNFHSQWWDGRRPCHGFRYEPHLLDNTSFWLVCKLVCSYNQLLLLARSTLWPVHSCAVIFNSQNAIQFGRVEMKATKYFGFLKISFMLVLKKLPIWWYIFILMEGTTHSDISGADLDYVTYGLWRTKILPNCSKIIENRVLVLILILIQIWHTRKSFLNPPLAIYHLSYN